MGRSSKLLNTSLMTCEQTSLLVRGIERVDSGAVSTGWDTIDKVSVVSIVVPWGKVGSISVELEVTVSWVMWVDEWVEVGVNWLINIVIVNCLSYRSRSSLADRSWSSLDRSSNLDRSLGYKSSRFLTSSSGWNMSSFQDPETVLPCGVSDSDGLAIIINVAVLAYPLPVSSRLLPVHSSVLLGESRTKSAISSIESLLFQNLCILWLNKLTTSSSDKTRGGNQSKHDDSQVSHSSTLQ